MVKTQVTVQGATQPQSSAFRSPVCRAFFLFAFMSVLMVGYSACRKEEEPPPPPCTGNLNEWDLSLKIKEDPEMEYQNIPVYTTSTFKHIELKASPRAVNKCPRARRMVMYLVNDKTGVVDTRTEDVNISDTYTFSKIFSPGPGDYYFSVALLDEKGEVIGSINQSQWFKVQIMLSKKHPVLIGVNAPYDGQKIKKGIATQYMVSIDPIYHGQGYVRIVVLDNLYQPLKVLRENEPIKNVGLGGTFTLQNTGEYFVYASTYHLIVQPSGVVNWVLTNQSSSEITITN